MNSPTESTNHFTPFWPLGLLALSMVLFLGWQVATAAQQYTALLRLADQQNVLAGQATQAESNLKALMMDLLKLSKTDADARSIVSKYGIKFNPAPEAVPPVETVPPALKPLRTQRDAAAGSGMWTSDNALQRPKE